MTYIQDYKLFYIIDFFYITKEMFYYAPEQHFKIKNISAQLMYGHEGHLPCEFLFKRASHESNKDFLKGYQMLKIIQK